MPKPQYLCYHYNLMTTIIIFEIEISRLKDCANGK